MEIPATVVAVVLFGTSFVSFTPSYAQTDIPMCREPIIFDFDPFREIDALRRSMLASESRNAKTRGPFVLRGPPSAQEDHGGVVRDGDEEDRQVEQSDQAGAWLPRSR